MTFIIAIDGPAAAGKGTLSRRIARGIWLPSSRYGPDLPRNGQGAASMPACRSMMRLVAEGVARDVELAGLDRSVLSQHSIGEAASKIAVMPAVRRALVEAQRAFSRARARHGA